MTNLTKRFLTGLVLVGVILTGVRLGPFGFAGLLLLINLLSLREFYHLLATARVQPAVTAAYLLSGCMLITCLLVSTGMTNWTWLLLNLPVGFAMFVAALYQRGAQPFQALAITFLGITCISIPMCCFLVLPFVPAVGSGYQGDIPFSVFLLLWTHDSGAYLSGKLMGKHALFQRLSPKKTWEGSVGGAIIALLTACLLSRYDRLLTMPQWALLAMIIIVSGTYGDLIKSMLKRSLNVKDSGTILPGHGGMLDRFDSLLGSAPFVLIYLILLRQ